MAGLAFLLKRAGYAVTGCDVSATPRTRWLEACGIPVAQGHAPAHLAEVDELIVTPAVPSTAPERAQARARARSRALGWSAQTITVPVVLRRTAR